MLARKLLIAFAVVISAASGPTAIAEEPGTQGFNSGEDGLQTVTVNVTIPDHVARSHADVLVKLAGDCEFTTVGVPNTNDVFLIVAAHATSTPSSGGFPVGYPVATGVTCRVHNAFGSLEVREAMPFNTVFEEGAIRVRMSPFTLCVAVTVLYDENYSVTSEEVCRKP